MQDVNSSHANMDAGRSDLQTSIMRRHSDEDAERRVWHSSSADIGGTELPSYKLRPDRKAFSTLSVQAKRASMGSYFSPPSSSHDEVPIETNPVKRPNRRGSFRPFVAAASMSNLLSTKAASTEEHESKHYEAMVQHFQIRRLTPNEQPGAQVNSSTESNEDVPQVPIVNDIALSAIDPVHTSQSRSLSSRRKSFGLAQLSCTGSQYITESAKASNHSAKAQEDSFARVRCMAASRQSRFSLARTIKSWRRKLRSTWRRIVTQVSVPVSPYSAFTEARGVLLFISCMWYITYLPIKIAFSVDDSVWSAYVEVLIEILYIVDFLFSFNTSFVDKSGELVDSRKLIAWNYVTGWCLLDFLSSIPIRIIAILRHGHIGSEYPYLSGATRILRFFHVLAGIRTIWFFRARRARKGFSAWLLYSRYSHLHRILWVLLCIVYIAHWMACGWRLLEPPDVAARSTLAEDYASNFYDALQLLQGQGLVTDTLAQNLFAAFAVLIGSIVLAVVFGHVAILVSNFNANSTNYQRKIETIFAVMTKLQLPVLLRERIHQYYEHLWREYESLDGQLIPFSKELTHTLELEVLLFKYMAVIMHVPFWHEVSPNFLKQIVLQIQVRVYLPDDYVIRRGEIGDEYYVVNRGFCELLTGPDSVERPSAPLSMNERQGPLHHDSVNYEDPNTFTHEDDLAGTEISRSRKYRIVQPMKSDGPIVKLSRGQGFGEMALIMNYHRAADARALTYVEMCVLKRENFQRILLRYPEDRKSVMTRILTNTMVNNDIQNVQCPLNSVVRSVYGSSPTDKSITGKMAAALIVEVSNIDKDDDSLKFGIGIKVQERMKTLHEKQQQVSCYISGPCSPIPLNSRMASVVQKPSSPSKPTGRGRRSARLASLESRMDKVESTQIGMLQTIQQIHAALVDIKETQNKILALPADTTTPTTEREKSLDVNRSQANTTKPIKIRRASSAPSINPQVIIGAAAAREAAMKELQVSRRHTQMHLEYTDPHERGIRPLFRRMSSIVKIYAGFVAQEPPPSASQYADQLFFSRRHTPKDS